MGRCQALWTSMYSVSAAGDWIWSIVSCLSLVHIRILYGAKGLISINSYTGRWHWREFKAANKVAAPLSQAWGVSFLYAALRYYGYLVSGASCGWWGEFWIEQAILNEIDLWKAVNVVHRNFFVRRRTRWQLLSKIQKRAFFEQS